MITRTLPRLSVAAYAELASIDNPSLVLRVNIDSSGAVTDVRTVHSAGSENIDLPWERAVDTWWFEPRKNAKTGKAVADEVELEIRFR
jgi:TonB family protein